MSQQVNNIQLFTYLMQPLLQQKQKILSQLISKVQSTRSSLLQSIRLNPQYFKQFIHHIPIQKVQQFLTKNQDYKNDKAKIQLMKDAIENQILKQREKQLAQMGLPVHLRRALTSMVCAICLEKHGFVHIIILECGHTFHGQCVKKLKKSQCPQCRQVINLPMNQNSVRGDRF